MWVRTGDLPSCCRCWLCWVRNRNGFVYRLASTGEQHEQHSSSLVALLWFSHTFEWIIGDEQWHRYDLYMERASSATARGLQAEAKRASSGLNNIKLFEGDIEHAEFPSKSFDAILCSSAIFYFDMPSTVKRLHTWLKPGGLLAYNTLQVASCYLCIHQMHLLHALQSPAITTCCMHCMPYC